MASTAVAQVVHKMANFQVTKITVTWDNSDLTCQDIVHLGPKGVTPVVLQGLDTTAGTDIANFSVAFDNANGEINIVAQQEVGGDISSKVTEFYLLFFAFGDQAGGSITP